jgi:hypothetical protein
MEQTAPVVTAATAAAMVAAGPVQAAVEAASAVLARPGWRTVVEPALGFSAEFPGPTATSTRPEPTPWGRVNTAVVATGGPREHLAVSVGDLGEALGEDRGDPDRVLDRTVAAVIKATNGSAVRVSKIAVSGEPGRELCMLVGMQGVTLVYRARLVLVRGRVLLQAVAVRQGAGSDATLVRFTRSLRLLRPRAT